MACAYRLAGAAPEAEGALGAALWDAGASALELDGADLVATFEHRTAEVPAGGVWEDVDERDHVAAYFEGLDAVEVGELVIAPTHREVRLRAGQKVLWLDPGMAFGTGHHETTRLALAALADPGLDLRGMHVLDVGSGSGVLAIAADLLGAADARGVDVDPITLPIAIANATRNRSRARFAVADFGASGAPDGAGAARDDTAAAADAPLSADRASVDVLLANLFAELHVRFMPRYAAVLAPGGVAYLTGILDGRDTLVADAVPPGLRLRERRRDGEWWLLVLERPEAA